jgi:predicted NAD/FAD-dependent oxidoreductase
VRTGVKVTGLERNAAGWVVAAGGEEHAADEVVMAVPPAAAADLLPTDCPPLPDGWAARLGSSPIVNVHVVYDRKVLDEPFLAGVDTPVQWVFDRTVQSGLSEGQYVAVSLSAAHDHIGRPTADIRAEMLPALADLLPAVRQATVRDFFVTREREATFRPAPGTAALRPPPGRVAPGLYLAGAWTATGWPATMESAVRSGDAAAAALLADPAAAAPATICEPVGEAP